MRKIRLARKDFSFGTLEIQQAKYGGMGAPVVLTNQIDDVKREISQCDQTMRETRVRLAELEA
jgi:hypothetical protein